MKVGFMWFKSFCFSARLAPEFHLLGHLYIFASQLLILIINQALMSLASSSSSSGITVLGGP
jgi:hypothetical protein